MGVSCQRSGKRRRVLPLLGYRHWQVPERVVACEDGVAGVASHRALELAAEQIHDGTVVLSLIKLPRARRLLRFRLAWFVLELLILWFLLSHSTSPAQYQHVPSRGRKAEAWNHYVVSRGYACVRHELPLSVIKLL